MHAHGLYTIDRESTVSFLMEDVIRLDYSVLPVRAREVKLRPKMVGKKEYLELEADEHAANLAAIHGRTETHDITTDRARVDGRPQRARTAPARS